MNNFNTLNNNNDTILISIKDNIITIKKDYKNYNKYSLKNLSNNTLENSIMDYNKNIETTVSKKQYENETNYLNKVYKFRNNKNYDPKYKNIKNQQGKNLKNLMLDANDLLTYNNCKLLLLLLLFIIN